jgi:hypothetical protein
MCPRPRVSTVKFWTRWLLVCFACYVYKVFDLHLKYKGFEFKRTM